MCYNIIDVKKGGLSMPNKQNKENSNASKKTDLPPIVRTVPDPPVPNRAHTEMKSDGQQEKKS